MFFTAFFFGGMSGFFMASPKEALDVDAPIFSPHLSFVYCTSSSTDTSLLQLECTLFLSLSVDTDLFSSPSFSTLFIIVSVEVPLLLSDNEFCFQKMFATLLFKDQKGLSSLFHLLYFKVHIYTSSVNICSPILVCTFSIKSIMCSGNSQVKWFTKKSQLTFISLAILLNNNIFLHLHCKHILIHHVCLGSHTHFYRFGCIIFNFHHFSYIRQRIPSLSLF